MRRVGNKGTRPLPPPKGRMVSVPKYERRVESPLISILILLGGGMVNVLALEKWGIHFESELVDSYSAMCRLSIAVVFCRDQLRANIPGGKMVLSARKLKHRSHIRSCIIAMLMCINAKLRTIQRRGVSLLSFRADNAILTWGYVHVYKIS
ncbi:hypothetical protein F4814DRAFT_196583 [Daldinia grandis]|nr:hypothetical protein F4814DRAFT_196583 [Daldinia grandis]